MSNGNKSEICELEITGNLSTLRCTRFPRNNNSNNSNSQLNSNNVNNVGNNNNNNANVSNINFGNMMAQTTCVRYVESVASIGNGVNPVFYSRISRNNRPCRDNGTNNRQETTNQVEEME